MNMYNHEINPGDIKVVSEQEQEMPEEMLIGATSEQDLARGPGHRPGHGHDHGPRPGRHNEPSFDHHGPGHHHRGRPFHSPPHTLPGRVGRMRPERKALERSMGQTIHVWLKSGREFWFVPVFMGRTTVAGYAWKHGRWVYTGFSIFSIDFFVRL